MEVVSSRSIYMNELAYLKLNTTPIFLGDSVIDIQQNIYCDFNIKVYRKCAHLNNKNYKIYGMCVNFSIEYNSSI